MFKEARIKLTAYYLAIIMAISLSFSLAIFAGINRELERIQSFQNVRQQRIERINTFLRQNHLPVPSEPPQSESGSLQQVRIRIITILGIINVIILGVSGAGGYFLAGRTLNPIAKMVEEQKEFVGNASHELRTPLTSLKTEIEVFLRDKKSTLVSAKKLLASNLEDVNNMQRLSNYLLKLNKYESGTGLPMSRVDLKKVVEKATAKMNVKTNLKSTNVSGNEDALVELVTVLVDNAVKYSPKGKTVEVRTKSGGIIEVEDHGMGISEADLPHIFDRFYRSDKSRGTDGYGLGLSIAKSIVELHKGKITVNSKAGKGTVFTVTI